MIGVSSCKSTYISGKVKKSEKTEQKKIKAFEKQRQIDIKNHFNRQSELTQKSMKANKRKSRKLNKNRKRSLFKRIFGNG